MLVSGINLFLCEFLLELFDIVREIGLDIFDSDAILELLLPLPDQISRIF